MNAPLTDSSLPATSPLAILREVFGYPAFRGQQQAIIEHAAEGGDALVLMPTGGGKSLCYQVPAIARHRAGHGIGNTKKQTLEERADLFAFFLWQMGVAGYQPGQP